MPKKTASQSVGEIGVASITNLCTRAGWSVDQVYSDFGEDLVCQTFLDGKVDPFRILIQVKASATLKAINISRDHLVKWLCSADLVVLMFWTEETSSAYYYALDEKWRLIDIFGLPSTNVRIKASDWTPLTETILGQLEWKSRLRGLSHLLSNNKNQIHYIDHDQPENIIKEYRKSVFGGNLFIITTFLNYIDFVSIKGKNVHFNYRVILSAVMNIRIDLFGAPLSESKRVGMTQEESLVLVILWKFSELGVAVPGSLLFEATGFLNDFLTKRIDDVMTSLGIPSRDKRKASKLFCV
jgi:hypothetical protein